MWLYNYVCCFIIITIVTTSPSCGLQWCGQSYISTALCSATECTSPVHILLPFFACPDHKLSVNFFRCVLLYHFSLIHLSTPYNMLQLHLIIKWFIKILIAPSFLWLNCLRVSVKSQTILITYYVCPCYFQHCPVKPHFWGFRWFLACLLSVQRWEPCAG